MHYKKQPNRGNTNPAVIIILLLILIACCFIGWNVNDSEKLTNNELTHSTDYSTMIIIPPIDPIDTSTWITYIDSVSGFTFKYPSYWEMSDIEYHSDVSRSAHAYSVYNQEAKIQLTIGGDEKDDCGKENLRKIRFFDNLHNVCYRSENGTKFWSQLRERSNDDTLSISATSTTPIGIDIVNTILSTFQHIKDN